MQEIPSAPDAPARLAVLWATTNPKLPDCCVLLAAQDGQADAILTFDDRLRRAAERLGFASNIFVRPGVAKRPVVTAVREALRSADD